MRAPPFLPQPHILLPHIHTYIAQRTERQGGRQPQQAAIAAAIGSHTTSHETVLTAATVTEAEIEVEAVTVTEARTGSYNTPHRPSTPPAVVHRWRHDPVLCLTYRPAAGSATTGAGPRCHRFGAAVRKWPPRSVTSGEQPRRIRPLRRNATP